MKRGFFGVEAVLLLLVLVDAVLALLAKDHCRQVGWNTPDQYSTTCYSALPNIFTDYGLGDNLPYALAGFDAPPVSAGIAAITAWLSGFASSGTGASLAFFDVNAVLLVSAWMVGVLALARSNPRRPWDAAVLAVSPLLFFAAFTGWQLWAVALTGVGFCLLRNRDSSPLRSLAAGLAFGAATCVNPLLVALPLSVLLLALRRQELRTALPVLLGSGLAWLMLNLPVLFLAPAAWTGYWWRLLSAEPSMGSWYGVLNRIAERLGLAGFNGIEAALLALGLMLVGICFLAWFLYHLRQPPRLAQLGFLLLGWFLVVDKNALPENLVLLLPLLALTVRRWSAVLLWQVCAVLFYLAYLLRLGVVLGDNDTRHGIDLPYYALALLAASVATIGISVSVLSQTGRARADPHWPAQRSPEVPAAREPVSETAT